MKVNKPSKKCPIKCPDHTFSFKHIRNDLLFKQDAVIMYCPQYNVQSLAQENFIPQFNKDGKPYTPAFILPIEKVYYLQNDEKLRLEHNQKINQSEQKKQILFPKPSRKCKYCSVCKSNYQDYLEHIKLATHKKAITSSKFNNHILDLCKGLFNNENRKEVIIIKDSDSQYSQYAQKKNSFHSTEYERPPYKKRHIQKYNLQQDISNYFNPIQQNDFINNYAIPNEMVHNLNLFNLWNKNNINAQNFDINNTNKNGHVPYGHSYLPFTYNPLTLNLYNGMLLPQIYPMQQMVNISLPQISQMNFQYDIPTLLCNIPPLNYSKKVNQAQNTNLITLD